MKIQFVARMLTISAIMLVNISTFSKETQPDPLTVSVELFTKLSNENVILNLAISQTTEELLKSSDEKARNENIEKLVTICKNLHQNGIKLFAQKQKFKDELPDYLTFRYVKSIIETEFTIENLLLFLSERRIMELTEGEKKFYLKYLEDVEIAKMPFARKYFDRVAQFLTHIRSVSEPNSITQQVMDNFLFGEEGTFVRYLDLPLPQLSQN